MISALKTMWRWKWKKWRSLRSFALELIDQQREIVSIKLLQRNSMMPSQTSKMTIACIVPCFMVSKESSLESNSNVLRWHLTFSPSCIYHLIIIHCNFIQAQNKIDVHICGPFYSPRNKYHCLLAELINFFSFLLFITENVKLTHFVFSYCRPWR